MTDLNKHPILRDLYNLVQRMEREFPASTLETDCCIKAQELSAMLGKLVEQDFPNGVAVAPAMTGGVNDEIVASGFHMERMDHGHIWFVVAGEPFDLHSVSPIQWTPQGKWPANFLPDKWNTRAPGGAETGRLDG